jgi:hypothetical protein
LNGGAGFCVIKIKTLCMSKQRIIKDEMWSDDWFFELDPSEKLMWVFLLTNPRNNVAGVFNVSIAWISAHTGFTKDVVELILKRFGMVCLLIYT